MVHYFWILFGVWILLASPIPIAHCSYSHSNSDPAASKCPPANCADPQYDTLTSCSSCEASECRFRGCVNYGAFGPTWRPDNCTLCYCHQEKEECTKIDCEPPKDCFGYPLMHVPGKCCSECDFNVSRSECGLVPIGRKSLYVAMGDGSCQEEVVFHECGKDFIVDDDGKWWKCENEPTRVTHALGERCMRESGISHVTFEDVTQCRMVPLSGDRIPQDYNSTPYHCSIYVEPKRPLN